MFHFYEINLSSLPLQLGTFRSQDGDYFIEPLLSVDEQEDEDEQNKPHVIYRLGTAHGEPSTERHACDTSGIRVFLQRDPTPVVAHCPATQMELLHRLKALPLPLSFI